MGLALAVALALPSAAQEEPSGTSYVTPFPEGDVYKLQAYGDPLAEGILSGLVEAFAGDSRMQVSRKHRVLGGLTRNDFDDEMKAEEQPGREAFHIGVVMIGMYDRNNMRTSPRDFVRWGTDEWRKEYGRRVDSFIKTLKRRGVAVYWVGQPAMRSPQQNEAAQAMNDIVREKAYLNGAKFIDIAAHFADEAGNYAPWGPDITGKQKLLRENDGVMFTYAGNRKLALFVEQEIKRDLAQAKNERAIPLAGNDLEQKRIAALKPRQPPPGDGGWRGTISANKEEAAAQQKSAAARPKEAPRAGGAGLAGAEGGQWPHHAQKHRRGGARGIRHHRHPAPRHPLGRDRARHPQGDGREGLADGRRRCRRCRGRACRAELDHAVRPWARHHAPDIGAELEPLLQGAGQGRASRAQARQGRRLQLAARRAPAHSRAAGRRGPPHPTTRHLAEGRPAAVVGGIAGFPGPPRLLPRSSACTLRYADKGGQSFMPKMSDSRRKKIQARQRRALNILRREKKAAKREQKKA